MLAGTAPDKSKTTLELPEGATVKQALLKYAQMYPAPYNINDMKGTIILRNDSPAKFIHKLMDNDRLVVFKPLLGG